MLPIVMLGVGTVLALAAATLVAALIGRAGFPVPPPGGRIGRVDGLRGYLALFVIAHHFILWTAATRLGRPWAAPELPLFNELGAAGVALFFMTTGLVFYPRVLAGLRATAWPAVLVTRLFRLVPLVVVSVLAVLAVVRLRTGAAPDRALPPALLGWIGTWAEPPLLGYPDSGRINAYVLWSLWYEWLFYLVVLPASALARDLVRGRLPSWAVPAGLLAAAWLASRRWPGLTGLRYLPLFALGMLAFEVQRRANVATRLRSPVAGAAALGLLALACVRYREPYGTTPMLLLAGCFACVACGNDLFGLLRTRGALVLGECSFGLYLLHGVVLDVAFVDGRGFTGRVPIDRLPLLLPPLAAALVPLTAATYLLVERPAIRRGARIAAWWTGRRVSSTAQAVELAP